MTPEEKAKAYDEALEIARQIHNGNPSSGTAIVVCEQIFPQLRESEDERIRKNLMRMVQNVRNDSTEEGYYDIPFDKYLAYLEKKKEQKPKPNYCHYGGDPNIERCKHCSAACIGRLAEEQKPAEWSEEDKEALDMCLDTIPKKWKTKSGILLTKWLKDNIQPQPKPEWSEEDSKRYISIGTTLGTSEVLTKEDYDANMAWLRELVNAKKYLRHSWKPSE